jgi:hypothetical protein
MPSIRAWKEWRGPSDEQRLNTWTNEIEQSMTTICDLSFIYAAEGEDLPVYEPGALLFVGDGHALQGEGEVVS